MQDNQNTTLPNYSGSKGKNFLKTYKKPLVAVGAALAVLAILWGVYCLGYNKGHDKGFNKGKTEAAAKARTEDPLRAMADMNRNYWSIVGTVEAVDGNSVTVKNNKGKIEKATFIENLEVTQKSNKNGADKSAIKTGQNVIVIGQKNDDKLTVSRVTIKE